MDDAIPSKICTLCKKKKPLTDFGKNHTLKDGKNSSCRSCVKLKNKANYIKHKERYAATYAAYRAGNREKNSTYASNYRRENRHKTPISAIGRRVIKQRYRARKLALPDTWTPAQLAFMLDYWHHACAVCGNPKGLLWTLAYDHWIPIASENCPGTVATNMLPLCHGKFSCNSSKNYSAPHAWLMRRFGSKKAATIERTIHAYFAHVALVFPEEAA